MTPSCTLRKEERLHGVSAITELMHRGHYGVRAFLRYCYAEGNGLSFNRILISVPKRRFKRAVKRNLLKRRIRESYRLQKGLLGAGGFDILFIYSSEEVKPFADIYAAIGHILNQLARHE